MAIPSHLKGEFEWWLNHIDNASQNIKCPKYTTTIFSDASRSGWGTLCNNQGARGFWQESEREEHINILELKAAFFALKTFAKYLKNYHVLLKIDNKTAVSVINKMESAKYNRLNSIAKQMWHWREERRIFIFATYINT